MDRAEGIATVHGLLATITSNIAYIRAEIPALEMPAALTVEITTRCDEYESALYDIRKEVRVLEDKLGMHPGAEPFDPNAVNPDPGATVALILAWLEEQTRDLDATVIKVQGLADCEPGLRSVEVLLNESGANILSAAHAVRDVLRSISARSDA